MTILYYLLKMVMFILYYLYSNISMYCLGDRRSEKNRTIGAFDDARRTGGIVGTFVDLQQTV